MLHIIYLVNYIHTLWHDDTLHTVHHHFDDVIPVKMYTENPYKLLFQCKLFCIGYLPFKFFESSDLAADK
jgi:hypothetical protein